MSLPRYVRLLEGAFILNLVLMTAVLVDFLLLGQGLVTYLVWVYAIFVLVLLVGWIVYEARMRRQRTLDAATGQDPRPVALPHGPTAGPINR